jgi:uncharacterized DUF497 family protein/uncharacterized protein (DUF4415 family)
MKIVWDEPKRLANIEKHGLDFADLSLEFFDNAVVEPAKQGRFLAFGELDGVVIVAVVFRPLGSEALSVISMRPASKIEREADMTSRWPRFVTKDLKDSDYDAAEMQRRWEHYNREMQAIIAKGGVHQDEDGWWVETATGELVGPDPELERPHAEEELARAKPLKEAMPALYESIRRSRGRPPIEKPKEAVTLRLDPDTLARFKATGKDWRTKMADALEKAAHDF